MKTNLKIFGSLFVICLLGVSTQATILFQDNFNYPDGILTNSTWVAGAGNTLNSAISVAGGTAQIAGSSTSDQPRAYFTNAPAGIPSAPGAPNFPNTTYFFPSNCPVAALYYSFTINENSPATVTNTYFAYLTDTNFNYRCRLVVITNAPNTGNYRIGVRATSTTLSYSFLTNMVQQDLSPGTTYTIVARYIPGNGLCTVWVNPTSETNNASSVVANDTVSPLTGYFTATTNNCTAGIGLRNALGTGLLSLNNLVVATSFGEVLPSSVGSNPPFIVTQPQDNTNLFIGNSVTNGVVAGGDTLSYQWYFVSNSVTTVISGATNPNLPLNNVQTNQSGFYYVVLTNVAGVVTSRQANILISPVPVAPTITSPASPYSQTNIVGDTVNFTVTASGVPAPAYNWFVVTNGVTNAVTGANVTGANTPTLTITSVLTNQSGAYFATVTNLVGKTNSPLITLVVNPIPFVTIASLHAMVDPTTYAPTNTTSLFTVQGIVTTWTNMTTSGNSEFYIQDNSGGIAVFWSGAASSTNLPPAGALVQVTAPLAQFDGLLELEPVFGTPLNLVAVLSTNNPLPTPQPLPFDPNVQNNYPVMESLVGSYFVASNVMLNLSTPTFGANANDPTTNLAYHVLSDTNAIYNYTFTNDAGQTFILFLNSHTDIPGQTKPTGPVTIYGVLGQFVNSSPYVGGYEFTPSRFADIISYFHATNVLSNVSHWGDALTNTFTESALRPGETLTTYVSASDAAGGSVTLTPVTDGLPASASWSNVTGGQTATAVFHFSPLAGDAGSNYVVTLAESSTSGFVGTNYWNVYVPTPAEQQMAITEFLANPATNTSAPDFNPLNRLTDTIGVSTNDQFIEVVNLSDTLLDYGWDIDAGNPSVNKLFDSNAGSGTTVSPSSSVVIYGGDTGESPNLPATAATSGSLLLPTSGTGVIVLRNPNGHIIDRVVYSGGDLNANSSLSRFPTINSPFVPQAYVSTNFTTAGLQYDGSFWSSPAQIPTGVNNVVIGVVNNQAVLQFTAVSGQASTLWSASSLTNSFKVIYGQPFSTSAGVFSVTNLPPIQFYFITTQTNGVLPN
jgi:hypothetical protein